MQEGFLHFLQFPCLFPFMPYILAEGPHQIAYVTFKIRHFGHFSTSFRMDVLDRETINFPWWAEMVQKAQPPKQPRCMFTENLIIS